MHWSQGFLSEPAAEPVGLDCPVNDGEETGLVLSDLEEFADDVDEVYVVEDAHADVGADDDDEVEDEVYLGRGSEEGVLPLSPPHLEGLHLEICIHVFQLCRRRCRCRCRCRLASLADLFRSGWGGLF